VVFFYKNCGLLCYQYQYPQKKGCQLGYQYFVGNNHWFCILLNNWFSFATFKSAFFIHNHWFSYWLLAGYKGFNKVFFKKNPFLL